MSDELNRVKRRGINNNSKQINDLINNRNSHMPLLDFITNSASNLIDSIGNIVDDLVTTDEEKQQLKNKLAKELNNYKLSVLQAQNEYEKELTSRLKYDMTSDSWLSKNIRPISLAFLLIAVVTLAYSTVFILPNEINEMLKEWIDLFKTLLITVVGFYFGSRGIEKIKSIKNE